MSPVKYHLLVSSRLTLTVPTSVETVAPLALTISPLMLPVKVVESEKLSVKVESSPTRISPVSSWPPALSVAIFEAPVQPSSHTDRRTPSPLSLIVTPSKLMTALVFVTWKTCPV